MQIRFVFPKLAAFAPYFIEMNQNFKFRDMKVFGSNEWMANNEKKYRLVYDQSETTYIWAEFSFYNKKFDEESWNLNCQMKCFSSNNRLICDQNADMTVQKDDNIVYIRKGWGMDEPGAFWKQGSYRWEAWVDGQMVATKTFYIENQGTVTENHNPYFKLKSIRLYESGYNDTSRENRHYLTAFASEETRYIWAEFEAENLVHGVEKWACELFFNFYNDTGQLKGSISKLLIVHQGDTEIRTTVGWGSESPGSWYKDNFRLEVIFMDRLIAKIPFVVGDENIHWTEETGYGSFNDNDFILQTNPEKEETLD
ncbi:MAG: AAA family ATPase, partial [Bacteroidia bacterium]|nr:AAA family ATPase [Bacteroidia bacterium]